MPDVHLFLLIHGLWGKPEHMDAARAELEAAWDSATLNAYFKANGGKDGKGANTSGVRRERAGHELTPPNVDSGPNSTYASPAMLTSALPDTSAGNRADCASASGADDNDKATNGANGPANGNGDTTRKRTLFQNLPARTSNSSDPDTADSEELVVVVAQGMTAKLTYDGVDVCASRVAWEVDQHVAALEADGKRVTKFSVLGYSLGGLVARYLVGLLHARSPSFFDQHVPVSFTTMATPNLGIPRYNTLLSSALAFLGARLMSRTGQQIYVADKYSDSDPRPLLEIMADPKHVFHQGLARFSAVSVYANVVNDATVPFPSAAIETTDPFVQWDERGLEIEADDIGLVSDWHYPALEQKPKKKWGYHLGTLPPVLRFRWPYNYIILALFPILFPILFLLILVRFSLDTVRSRKRLQRLARVGAPTPAEPPSPASPASPASPIPSHHGLSIDALRAAIKAVERNIEQDLIQASDYELGAGVGHEAVNGQSDNEIIHNHEHRTLIKGQLRDNGPASMETKRSKNSSTGYKDANDTASSETAPLFFPEPTIHVRMTEPQLRMVHWLNALDPVKHLVWFPDVSNSHAVMIVRDPHRIAFHERGRGILRHWAATVAEAAMVQ